MSECMQCKKELTYNEIGAHKKFINRGSTSFLCKTCLARTLGVTVGDIDEKIEQFIQQGCSYNSAPSQTNRFINITRNLASRTAKKY